MHGQNHIKLLSLVGYLQDRRQSVLWLLGHVDCSSRLRPSLTLQFAEPDEEMKWT